MTDISLSATVEEFKAATQALVAEGRAGVTQARWRALATEDAEIRRRWKLAHGADDGLRFGQLVRYEDAAIDPRSA